MRTFIEKTIELLKAQVKENLNLIEQNQIKIRKIFEQNKAAELVNNNTLIFTEIEKVLNDNKIFIDLQLNLIAFLEKNKSSFSSNDEIELPSDLESELPTEESVMFDMTIQGELIFDKDHPLFANEKFFEKLIRYYTSVENYEKCSELLMARNY